MLHSVPTTDSAAHADAQQAEEAGRLAALYRLEVLDTESDERFDRLVNLAAAALEVPIAAISLVDRDRQWFKARVGLEPAETPRDVSFCAHAIADRSTGPFVVPDARADARFADNPLVTGDPNIRFYAAQVIHSIDGHALGTLCVIDRVQRELDEAGSKVLAHLAALVEDELARRDRYEALLRDHGDRYYATAALTAAPVGLALLTPDRRILRCNAMFADQAGRSPEQLIGEDLVNLVGASERALATRRMSELVAKWEPLEAIERPVARPDGRELIVDVQIALIDEPEPLLVVRTVDVTSRRKLLNDLARYRYFFESSNDIIAVVDRDLRASEVNLAATRVFGITAACTDLTAALRHCIHPADRATFSNELMALRNGERDESRFTVRAHDSSGKCLHIEFAAVDLLDEPGVDGIVLVGRDVSEQVRLTSELRHRAAHDPLTGLSNRSVFSDELGRRLAGRDRLGATAVAYLDLDGFKQVNDTGGHHCGDELLTVVATTLQENVRPSDLVARMGGDEFAVLIDPVGSEQEAVLLTARLERCLDDAIARFLRNRKLPRDLGGRRPVGASFGCAVSKAGDSGDTLSRRADAALYRHKSSRACAAAPVLFQTAW